MLNNTRYNKMNINEKINYRYNLCLQKQLIETGIDFALMLAKALLVIEKNKLKNVYKMID